MTLLKTDKYSQSILRRAKLLAGRSLYLPTEAPHFQVEVNGHWYIFCSIHKNASSSIRALCEAGSTEQREMDESIFRFLYRNHLVRSHSEIQRASRVMAFLRHPLERVASCFQNKFIQKKGERMIFRDYARVTGLDPEQATFERFVQDYLNACFHRGRQLKVGLQHNRHIYTQQQQLLPVGYDVVAKVEHFNTIISEIGLGHLLPERANATSNAVAIPGACHMSARELHARYRETGETSDKDSLMTTELEEQINYLYRADISAFRHLFVMDNT